MALMLGLPVVLVSLIFVSSELLFATSRELVRLVHSFPIMMQDIMLSLSLVVGGALLFDLCAREAEESK